VLENFNATLGIVKIDPETNVVTGYLNSHFLEFISPTSGTRIVAPEKGYSTLDATVDLQNLIDVLIGDN